MLASNVIISEETKKRNQLSKRQQGKLRYEKLAELDRTGQLQFATTRNELAQMLGYRDNDSKGISWVNNMVNRGYIVESLVGRDGRTVRKEFHLTQKKPDYGFENVKKAHLKMKAEEKAKEIILKEKLEEVEKLSNLTITKGDLSISTTLGQDNIVRVITSIFN